MKIEVLEHFLHAFERIISVMSMQPVEAALVRGHLADAVKAATGETSVAGAIVDLAAKTLPGPAGQIAAIVDAISDAPKVETPAPTPEPAPPPEPKTISRAAYDAMVSSGLNPDNLGLIVA